MDDELERPRRRGRKKRSPLEDLLQDLAARFLLGEWRQAPPEEPGVYALAGRDGGFCGYCLVSLIDGRPRYVRLFGDRRTPYIEGRKAADVHVGWWFSEPMPALPSAPKWNPVE